MHRSIRKIMPSVLKSPAIRHRHDGQNLVELVLTLPFVLVLSLFLLEFGRLCFVFQVAGTAVRQAVQVAAAYHNESVGQQQLNKKISASGLTGTGTVSQMPNLHAYQASAAIQYSPLFSGSIPTLSGNITVVPKSINVTYTSAAQASIY